MADSEKDVIKHLNKYLKAWYQGMRAIEWLEYDSHLAQPTWVGQYGYYGYWAFEAAAVAFSKNIDDSSLHQYLHYPKDIVTYAKSEFADRLSSGMTIKDTVINAPKSKETSYAPESKCRASYMGEYFALSIEDEQELLSLKAPSQIAEFIENKLQPDYYYVIDEDFFQTHQWTQFELIVKKVTQSTTKPKGIDDLFLDGGLLIKAGKYTINYKSADRVKKITDELLEMDHDQFELAFDDAVFHEALVEETEDDISFSRNLTRFFSEAANRSLAVIFIVKTKVTQ